jgi:hypothetical protein
MPNKSGFPHILGYEAKSASFSLTEADSGKVFLIQAVDLVASLPATSAALAGVTYKFFVLTPSAGTGFSVSPTTEDQIRGKGITAAENKDIINSGASDAIGDYLEVVCDGALGWLIVGKDGTWARQA